MKRLRRRRPAPRARTTRPAEPYLALGAAEARRLGHNYVGTEHVLLVLIRDREGGATMVLRQLGVTADAVEEPLAPCIGGGATRIDADALATLGIDFDAVRERLEETFGPGALEQTRSACLGIAPRLKLAFAYALDYADGQPLADEHILLGLLSVPDSLASHVLGKLGVSLQAVEAIPGRAASSSAQMRVGRRCGYAGVVTAGSVRNWRS
jgi:ATP-dependent Clp protease ATP-binding subunit ClpA